MAKPSDIVGNRVTVTARKARAKKTLSTEEKVQKMYIMNQEKKK